MKRLLLIFLTCALFAQVEGQLIRPPFARAQVSGTVELHDSLDASSYYLHARFLYGDGSATYMTDDGSVLTQWTDQSGDNNHIVNASGTDRPAKDAVNEEIDFDDTDDYLADGTFAYTQPITIYMVVRINTAANFDDLIRINSGTTGKIQIPDATNRTLRVFGGDSFFDTGNGFYPSASYFILCVVFNNDVAGGSSIQVNGGSATTGTLATASSDRIELTTTTGANPGVSIKELIIRTTADGSALRTAIINNLNSTYSVY
jgi:hypothetical protein